VTGDSGSSVIVLYLLHTGIKAVDIMVVSHGDSDHSRGGGVEFILKSTLLLIF
jgi:beta-lactamase superfamily II metal-dependent hydrolase